MEKDFKSRYYTSVFTIGQVMTKMNNPLKEEGIRADEVDSKDLPRGFITAKECSKWVLKNFSKIISKFNFEIVYLTLIYRLLQAIRRSPKS